MDDEDLLLDSSALSFDVTLGEYDEAALLDDDEPLEGGITTTTTELIDEGEELDYDEEPEEETERERARRPGKFTSERVSMRRSSAASTGTPSSGPIRISISRKSSQLSPNEPTIAPSIPPTNWPSESKESAALSGAGPAVVASSLPQPEAMQVPSVPPGQSLTQMQQNTSSIPPRAPSKTAPKVLINPHYKGTLRPTNEMALKWNPSLALRNVTTLPQPRPLFMPTVPFMPVVNLRPPTVLRFPSIPSSSADFTRPPPPTSLMGMTANFNRPPPPMLYTGGTQPPFQGVPQGMGIRPPTATSTKGGWDEMVEGFLRRTTIRRGSRSKSRSSSSSFSRSRSRSYSSRSRSRSRSWSSSGSSRSSRSRRHREGRFKSRRSTSRQSRQPRNGNYGRGRYGDHERAPGESREMERRERQPRTPDVNQQEKSMECAKAIGLDSEYLTKLEEQKRMREEVLRKKKEHRNNVVITAHETNQNAGGQNATQNAGGQNATGPVRGGGFTNTVNENRQGTSRRDVRSASGGAAQSRGGRDAAGGFGGRDRREAPRKLRDFRRDPNEGSSGGSGVAGGSGERRREGSAGGRARNSPSDGGIRSRVTTNTDGRSKQGRQLITVTRSPNMGRRNSPAGSNSQHSGNAAQPVGNNARDLGNDARDFGNDGRGLGNPSAGRERERTERQQQRGQGAQRIERVTLDTTNGRRDVRRATESEDLARKEGKNGAGAIAPGRQNLMDVVVRTRPGTQPMSGQVKDWTINARNQGKCELQAGNPKIQSQVGKPQIQSQTGKRQVQSQVVQVNAGKQGTDTVTDHSPGTGKKKAYLAVSIRTVHKTLPQMDRMKMVAATIGATKKVWKSHNDCVSLIFEEHENAKKFMLQYNGKVINGIRLIVMLEKVFVNLAEV